MATYYEELVTVNSREKVTVCIPPEKFSEFLIAIEEHNKNALVPAFSEALRANVKRLTKGSISYQDFRGAYF